jgi:hypothetical protein
MGISQWSGQQHDRLSDGRTEVEIISERMQKFPSADIDSDHQLILCKFQMTLTRVKKAKQAWQTRYDTDKILAMQEEIAKRSEDEWAINEETTLNHRCKEITNRLAEIADNFRKDKQARKVKVGQTTGASQ